MLSHLHVKNLAVVENIDIDFDDGFIVLTGETGVGKSVIIGSVSIALGSKVTSDIIRAGAEYALVEIVFDVDGDTAHLLKEFDVFPDDGQVIISRKIMAGRSVSRINGETVTLSSLRKIASLLIDLHGQHEHQSLLYTENHLAIIDRYNRDVISGLKEKVTKLYGDYKHLSSEYDSFSSSDEERAREISFLEFEKKEIENARIGESEEEDLAALYRKLSNAEKLVTSVGEAYGYTSLDGVNAMDLISSALSSLNRYSEYDETVASYANVLADVENILSDVNREMSSYIDDFTFDGEEFAETERRLDYIRKLFSKYGGSYSTMIEHYNNTVARIDELENFEQRKEEVAGKLALVKAELDDYCGRLSAARSDSADKLKKLIGEALLDMNFADSVFDVKLDRLGDNSAKVYSANGWDKAEFLISTNPGEPVRPLAKVASGGELSRIMLAIKSVLAEKDSIHTLIFDEIDTGISGRTAQKISEKLAALSSGHQVICITHLAQIAAMADVHYLIRKEAAKDSDDTIGQKTGRVHTTIERLDEAGVVNELARIIGGAQITDAVLQSAAEMKKLAGEVKTGRKK